MMLNLKTGRVPGYDEGQELLIYLVTTAQVVRDSNAGFVFSNGHGLATFTDWFDDLANLDKVDWSVVYERYWKDTLEDMDRQRRKQAEFMVHKYCDWSLIQEIGVINQAMKTKVEAVFADYPAGMHKPVAVKSEWYYY